MADARRPHRLYPCSITISVWIAAWDKRFYDALAAFDGASMPSLIVEYLGYMAMVIGCIVCADWLQNASSSVGAPI